MAGVESRYFLRINGHPPTIQYNNVDSFAGINFRLNYIFRPGDDLFLVITKAAEREDRWTGKKTAPYC